MSTPIPPATTLGRRQTEFEALVESCERSELSLCLRLLGMYLGIYKLCYGEIAADDCARIARSAELDGELGEIVDSGLAEASAMLEMVRCNNAQGTLN